MWPIGLACVIGLAVGFGVGYTVALREQVPAPEVAAPARATLPQPDASSPVNVPTVEPQAVEAPAQPGPVPSAAVSALSAPAFTGRLTVRSTPAGARVIIDGRDRGASPAAVSGLKQGEHRVRVLHDGYTTAERRVVLSTLQPSLALSVPLAKAPVAPPAVPKPASGQPAKADAAPKTSAESGSLVLDSRPTGATVFVDGRPVGTTPLTMPEVKAGDHTVRFELEEHRSWAGAIKVVGGTTNRVGGSLEKID